MTEKRISEIEIESARRALEKDRESLMDRHAARTEQAQESVEAWKERDEAASKAARTPPPLTRQNR